MSSIMGEGRDRQMGPSHRRGGRAGRVNVEAASDGEKVVLERRRIGSRNSLVDKVIGRCEGGVHRQRWMRSASPLSWSRAKATRRMAE